jgi:hypothetical protein
MSGEREEREKNPNNFFIFSEGIPSVSINEI